MAVKLFKHQKNALEKAKNGNLALFHDCGCGKTLTALSIIDHWRQYYEKRNEKFAALVVCPLSIIEPAWIADCRKFMPHISMVSLWSRNPKIRERRLAEEHQVYAANFETFKSLFRDIQAKEFKVMIIDESSKIKSPKSQITRAALALAGIRMRGRKGVSFEADHIIPHRYVLSGTPAPNDRSEYWAQMSFVAPGEVFSRNFYSFRGRYFTARPLGRTGVNLYSFTKERDLADEFNEKMAPFTDVVSKETAVDLPEQVHEVRTVKLSKAEQAAYEKMRRELVLKLAGEEILATSALVEVMKARQLTSGFCYGDKGVHQIGKSKLKELKELLEEIGVPNGHYSPTGRADLKSETANTANQTNTEMKSTGRQVIIWCSFRHEMEIISQALKSAAVFGGDDDQRSKAISDFQSGKKRYLIANPQSAGHGLTFVNCNYAIYFSITYSYELLKQSQDRIHRIGQKTKCTYYYLIAEKTIDQVIYDALSRKEEMSAKVLEYLRSAAS
mgnify:CR=1 FL=1